MFELSYLKIFNRDKLQWTVKDVCLKIFQSMDFLKFLLQADSELIV